MRRLALVSLSLVVAARVLAQPAGDKDEAKRLMQTGVKLLEQKDYLAALSVFKDAYRRFPSSKILLNIGTTLKLLDRKAEAATTYQRYLDAPDADSAKRTEVNDVITDLDKSLGHVSVTLDPPDAEIQVGEDWIKGSRILHLDPGPATIHVRKTGFDAVDRQVTTTAGQELAVAIQLSKPGAVVMPPPPPKQTPLPVGKSFDKTPQAPHNEARVTSETTLGTPEQYAPDVRAPRSRIGAFAMGHVSVYPAIGSAVLVGPTFDATPRLTIDAAVILGPGLVAGMTTYTVNQPPSFGAYAGGNYALSGGPARPRVSLGVPMFISGSPLRIGVRAAGGVEYVASRHLSLIAELGVEVMFNGERDITDPAVVPALAVAGRL